MPFNLIYWLKPAQKGSGQTAQFMESCYPGLFKAVDYEYEGVPKSDRLWIMHNPLSFNFSRVERLFSDYMYIRREYCKMFPCHRLTNGYSYYTRHVESYQAWFPSIYQSHYGVNATPSVGYYARDIRPETNLAFIDFAAHLPVGTPIVTMGDKQFMEMHLHSNPFWKHTYDREEFFKSCSHYFYYRPSDIEDPLPHTLLEAIQSSHRIVSPKSQNRSFTDGIDDLLSFVEHDTAFDPSKRGSCPDILLDHARWQAYLSQTVAEKFPRSNVIHGKLLYDWACKFL